MPKEPRSRMPKEPRSSMPKKPRSSMPKEPRSGMPKEPRSSMPEEPPSSMPEEPPSSMPEEPPSSMPEEPPSIKLEEPPSSMPQELPRSTLERLPRIIILAGFIGSGKSTFAKKLLQYYPDFVYVREDDPRDYVETYAAMENALKRGKSLVLDRQNLCAGERTSVHAIAQKYSATQDLILFDVDFDECMARIETRQGHPYLKTVKKARHVMMKKPYTEFRGQWWDSFLHRIVYSSIPGKEYLGPPPPYIMRPTFPWTKEAIDVVAYILELDE